MHVFVSVTWLLITATNCSLKLFVLHHHLFLNKLFFTLGLVFMTIYSVDNENRRYIPQGPLANCLLWKMAKSKKIIL